MRKKLKKHFEEIKKFEVENQKQFLLKTTLKERINILEDLLKLSVNKEKENEHGF